MALPNGSLLQIPQYQAACSPAWPTPGTRETPICLWPPTNWEYRHLNSFTSPLLPPSLQPPSPARKISHSGIRSHFTVPPKSRRYIPSFQGSSWSLAVKGKVPQLFTLETYSRNPHKNSFSVSPLSTLFNPYKLLDYFQWKPSFRISHLLYLGA